jgi:WhiB family transcriptional regulator, redox-sensing transcriptional regulator
MNTGDLVLLTQASDDERSWRDSAACAETETTSFFPSTDETLPSAWGGTSEADREVLALCAGCPVRTECLTHALRTPEAYGIWGGTTPGERESILLGLAG